MKKRLSFLVLAWLLFGSIAFCQSGAKAASQQEGFSITVSPGLTLPLGRDTEAFKMGGGGELSVALGMPFLRTLFAGLSAGYSFVPLKAVTSMSLVGGGLDAGLNLEIAPGLGLKIYGTGGYFYATLNDGSASGEGNFYARGGGSLYYAITPALELGLGASYRNFFGLYNDLSMYLGLSFKLSAKAASGSKAGSPKKKMSSSMPLNILGSSSPAGEEVSL